MARTAKPGALAKAQGNPGKRAKGVIEARIAEATKVADLLKPLTASTGGLPAPAMLQDPLFAGAKAVWDHLAPELVRTHRLPSESQGLFGTFCIYMAEWLAATLDLQVNGHDQHVKTVAGGTMERKRPAFDRREAAFANVMKLSERFGLTPHDTYSLFKDQALAAANNPGLFDQKPAGAQAAAQDPAAEAPPAAKGRLVGSAARHRSAPPQTVN